MHSLIVFFLLSAIVGTLAQAPGDIDESCLADAPRNYPKNREILLDSLSYRVLVESTQLRGDPVWSVYDGDGDDVVGVSL